MSKQCHLPQNVKLFVVDIESVYGSCWEIFIKQTKITCTMYMKLHIYIDDQVEVKSDRKF